MEATTRSTFVERSAHLHHRQLHRPASSAAPPPPPSPSPSPSPSSLGIRRRSCVVSAFNIRLGGKSCGKCRGKGAVECPGCKGSGRNKKNGNLFERWKCFDCQGFGLVSCPSCGTGGLTPEQRGER